MATGGELEEVEGIDGGGLNTGDVAEALDEVLAVGLGGVDDEGTATLAVAAATELALTGAELLGGLGLLDISTSTNGLEEGKGVGGLVGTGESSGVNDEGNLGDGGDLVTAGHQERSGSGGSKGRGSSETPRQMLAIMVSSSCQSFGKHVLLALVDLDVPLAPDLGGGEHATGTAHVTESGLTGAVSTTTGDTGDTGNSATCVVKRSRSAQVFLHIVACRILPVGKFPPKSRFS